MTFLMLALLALLFQSITVLSAVMFSPRASVGEVVARHLFSHGCCVIILSSTLILVFITDIREM